VRSVTSGRLESRSVSGFRLEASWLWQGPLPGTLDCLRAVLEL
jgi:hypothetical protein